MAARVSDLLLSRPRDAEYRDADIHAAEARHFWFRARSRFVQWAWRRYFPDARRLLDLGCGTGFVLRELHRRDPRLTLAGCDRRLETLAIARTQAPGALIFAADVGALPLGPVFDVVTALDVLEHVDEDEAALAAICCALKPGGGVILSVPQHPWLWSEIDDFSCHRRRYVRIDLERKAAAAGFEILRSTSLFATTLPIVAASRRRRGAEFDPAAELRIPAAVSRALGAMISVEARLISAGLSLPFGSSLMLIARRPTT